MTVDPKSWRESRPKKRMGAGVLIRDGAGRVLLVGPTYKQSWEIPGGSVEADESPRVACAREVAEELGLRLNVGRLLCMEWQGPEPDRSESLMFIYDGGVLADPFDHPTAGRRTRLVPLRRTCPRVEGLAGGASRAPG